jgi:class 3 adenylate cyclase/tetratricopeptide (TPR) repeat protein
MHCPSCGQENPGGFSFCGRCGAALAPVEAPREVRKVVTVVFCDLTGSTALGDVTDPEAVRAMMRAYYEEMRAILERHGGSVEKFIGDAVMAVFGIPVAHEDDALRAVRAAWEMRAAVPALGLRARIGVNTGEVVAGSGEALVTGDAVNVAARLEQAAEPGEILIGADTRRLVRDAVKVEPVSVTAKGKPTPVEAFHLLDVDPEAAAIARMLDTPLVGRAAELEQLQQAFDRAVRERRCHLFTLLGTAGVGKSRLVVEFLGKVDARVVDGRCLDYGEGITFWPVVSILKQLGTVADETLTRVVGTVASANEVFYAVRSLLENVASERPLVVVFDDIQWGEETFLDLIDHVADLSRGAPILLLCIARPELLDKRPGWGGGKLNATTILLEPLGREDCADLIGLHGGVDADLRDRILAAAEGNPLFVEEMVALAREVGDVSVPATVQALLQARIDQLVGDERSVIERGAVEGEVFHRGTVLELTRAPDVERPLVGLVRKELIYPTPPAIARDQAFRFRHLLLRDAAYGAMPKELRAELHERFADWLAANGTDLVELDELTGYHLEQAWRYGHELGRGNDELAIRAGERLWAAGRRAAARADMPGSLNLLRRAAALLPESDPRHEEALLDRLVLMQNLESPTPALREDRAQSIEALTKSSSARLRLHGRVAQLQIAAWYDPSAVHAEIEREADALLAEFEARGDERGMASVWELRAMLAWHASRAADTIAASDRSDAYASRAGVIDFPAANLITRYGPLVHGPFAVTEVLERASQLPPDMHISYILRGSVALFQGRYDEALAMGAESFARLEALGLPLDFVPPKQFQAEIFHAQGRFEEALAAWQEINELHRAHRDLGFLSTSLVYEANTRLAVGDLAGAERMALEGEVLGGPEDAINYAAGRRVRALVALARGELGQAEELARSALDYGYRIDFAEHRGEAHVALGHVLRAAGREDEARVEYTKAFELWDGLGWTGKSDPVRQLLVEL